VRARKNAPQWPLGGEKPPLKPLLQMEGPLCGNVQKMGKMVGAQPPGENLARVGLALELEKNEMGTPNWLGETLELPAKMGKMPFVV